LGSFAFVKILEGTSFAATSVTVGESDHKF